MQVFSSPSQYSCEGASCVTIGNFDGVHLGHSTLIQNMLQKAQQQHCHNIVVTFWPHPLAVLTGRKAPPMLVSRQQRLQLLERQQVEYVLEMPFTRTLAALEPAAFVAQVLSPLHCRELVIGYDFSLGKGRSGNVHVLSVLGKEHGFNVTQVAPVIVNNSIVSSSRMRDLLAEGQVEALFALTRRWHSFTAQVGHGFGRGKDLGVPTINMTPGDTLLPCDGVYATWVQIDDGYWPAVTSVGMNPTFGGNKRVVESHLLNTSLSAYERTATVFFVQRLRDPKQFTSPQELVRAIQQDINNANVILKKAVPPQDCV